MNLTPSDVITAFDFYEITLVNPTPDKPAVFIQGGPATGEDPLTNEKTFDDIAVLAAFYPDPISAETKAPGPADFDGREGERVRVRNVLIWFDPALPPEWQGRVRSAIATLRNSEFGVHN